MDEGVVVLADGRSMGYAMYGPADVRTVVYCHGFPGSRFEFQLIDGVLRSGGVDVRVVVFDRPGYGTSTFQQRRTLLDWPADVAAATERLGLDEFAVVGVSGGGPYAMACGFLLADRVTSLGVAVGVAPPDAIGMERGGVDRRSVPHSAVSSWRSSRCLPTRFRKARKLASSIE